MRCLIVTYNEIISLEAGILEGKIIFKLSLDQVCGLSQADKYLSEEILWILSEKSERLRKFSWGLFNESEKLESWNRKLKATITRQMNELASHIAGSEIKSWQEMEEIKAILERFQALQEKTMEILEE